MTFPAASTYSYSPYCGAPPDPAELINRWNLDPFLLLVIVAIACGYFVYTRKCLSISRTSQSSLYSGLFVIAAALVSPLCSVSVSLFSARIAQHMILLLAAAPLIALGLPGRAVTPIAGPEPTSVRKGLPLCSAFVANGTHRVIIGLSAIPEQVSSEEAVCEGVCWVKRRRFTVL